MSSTLSAVSFETPDVRATSGFWAAVLGRTVVNEGGVASVPCGTTQVGLRFEPQRTAKPQTNRLHLHVTSTTVDDQGRIVDEVLRLGGSRRGSGELPLGRDIYVNDPGGDEFCIIAPGNSFLAGCGPLGEVTCEGSPTAGRFWLDALNWTPVWDHDGQFAIQAPTGGTKLSWDGNASPDTPGWNRQRLVLTTADVTAEADRLTRLGATTLRDSQDRLTMTDPDGSAFLLLPR